MRIEYTDLFIIICDEVKKALPDLPKRKSESCARLICLVFGQPIEDGVLDAGVYVYKNFLVKHIFHYREVLTALEDAKIIFEITKSRKQEAESTEDLTGTRSGKELYARDKDYVLGEDGLCTKAKETLKTHFPHKLWMSKDLQSALFEALRPVDLELNPYWDKIFLDGKQLLSKPALFGKHLAGRSFSKRHCLSREDRKRVTLFGEEVCELYDIPHAYPTLLGEVLKRVSEEKDNTFKAETDDYLAEVSILDRTSDIYTKIASQAPSLSRDDAKRGFNAFVNSPSRKIRKLCEHQVAAAAVARYFEKRWPAIGEELSHWPEEAPSLTDWEHKESKSLVAELQSIERQKILSLAAKLRRYSILHNPRRNLCEEE